jgi:hypothetical protein
MFRLISLVFLIGLLAFPASAQPPFILPIRERITPANAGELSLYMMLSRRSDRLLWSPGASLLAVSDAADIDLYSVTDWLLPPLRIRLDQTLTDFAFSPDGQRLYTLIPGSLISWNTANTAMSDRFIADARRLAVSPNGAQVALLSRQNVIQIVTVETRETYTLTPTVTPDDISFSTDGRRLLVTDGAGGAETIDLALRSTERVFGEPAASPAVTLLLSAAYTGDGRRIISQPADGGTALSVWDARSGDAQTPLNRPTEFPRVYGWGLNTRAGIVAGAGIGMSPEQSAVLVWSLTGGDPLARLRHPGVRDAQPSPDGTLIASVGGGTLRLWATAGSLPSPEQTMQLSQVNVVAACDVFGVQPSLGELLDGQSVSLVWSWFAQTEQQVRDYLDAAIVVLDLDGLNIRPWIFFTQTLPDEVNDGYPTVYMYAPVGQMALGQHVSRVNVTWVQPISDGFADYGPGTSNLSDGGACNFTAR